MGRPGQNLTDQSASYWVSVCGFLEALLAPACFECGGQHQCKIVATRGIGIDCEVCVPCSWIFVLCSWTFASFHELTSLLQRDQALQDK